MATSLILSTVKFSNNIIVLGYCLFAATVISVAWNVELQSNFFRMRWYIGYLNSVLLEEEPN